MSGVLVTLVYVDWCPHCQAMKPVWDRVKADASLPWVRFQEFNGDKHKFQGVTGYPTIFGGTVERMQKYNGGANYESLRRWVDSLWET